MSARSYSTETKAAVMAALLTGQSINSAAKEYRIPRSTVATWKKHAKDGVYEGSRPQKEKIGELLLDYLAANLRALRLQSEIFSDDSWLKNQDAGELAVLHGVMTDKAIRLMEAFGRADDDSNTDAAN